jgi:polysaccharide transporter, PST family
MTLAESTPDGELIGARQVAVSSAVLLAENLIRLIPVAAVSFWIARQLGPNQFGILNFATAFTVIMIAIASMGMDTPVLLRLTTTTTQRGAIIANAFLLRLLAGVLVFLCACVALFAMRGHDRLALYTGLIIALSIIVYSPIVFDYWFRAVTVAGPPALVRISSTMGAVLAKAVCVVLGLGVIAFAWTVVLDYFLTGVGLSLAYVLVSRKFSDSKASLSWPLMRSLLVESRPYLVSATAVVVYMKIDVVMLAYMSGNTETGIYSLAQKMSEIIYVVPMILIDSAFPALVRRHILSDGTDDSHGQMMFDLAVGGALVAVLLSVLLVKPAIHLLFGAAYEPSIAIYRVHAWSCVAIALNQARLRWLAAVGLQRYVPTLTVVGVVANVALNLVLIPSMGGLGAAIATVVSYLLSGYGTSLCFRELRDIGRMQTKSLWPWRRLYICLRVWRSTRAIT